MANTIHLISKEYLIPNEVSNIIEKVAQKLNYDTGKSYNQEYDIIEINLFKENIEEYVSVSISNKSDYNDTFNNLYNINGYGMMIDIECYYENPILIPFLKEILKEIPELLVYNEEVLGGSGAYVYNRFHFENLSEKNSYTVLKNPPKDLNNLA